MRNRAIWLALFVLAAATLLMVFFVLPQISQETKPLTAAINEAGETVKEAVTEKPATAEAPKTPSSEVASAAQSAAPAGNTPPQATSAPQAKAEAAPVTPAFDVLRVEPDGSTVIAGRAGPGSTVEVSDGQKIVASAKADPSGDFALVLDDRLPAGDHELVLKATDNGRTITSEETATISVPADDSKKLLAMVTKPGKASRLLNVPAAQAGTAAPVPAAANAAQPAAAPAGTASDVAAASPTAPVSPAKPAAKAAEIQVSAVEIEGSRLFIAGIAPAGASLLGFADDQPVGRAKATEEGHFVIEGNIDLSVGNHIIAVEMTDSAGKTALRVDVPFNRPAGDQVAAVAGPQGPDAVSPIDSGAFDKLRNETAMAFSILKGLYQQSGQPTAEELAAARSSTAIALESLSEYRLPADASAAAQEIVGAAVAEAAKAAEALDKMSRDPEAAGTELADIGTTIEKVVGPVIADEAGGDLPSAPVAQSTPVGEGATPAGETDQVAATSPKTIAQAPLTESRNSVIIRRGDTLWQISRRVYGQGVRYTTIYLANQDQITNPDLIAPGQIFGVPDEALPDAEAVHRKRVQHDIR